MAQSIALHGTTAAGQSPHQQQLGADIPGLIAGGDAPGSRAQARLHQILRGCAPIGQAEHLQAARRITGKAIEDALRQAVDIPRLQTVLTVLAPQATAATAHLGNGGGKTAPVAADAPIAAEAVAMQPTEHGQAAIARLHIHLPQLLFLDPALQSSHAPRLASTSDLGCGIFRQASAERVTTSIRCWDHRG